jgi:4'-phosphopantetheinyl transferase
MDDREVLHAVILAVPPMVAGLRGPAQVRAISSLARTALAWSAAFSGVQLGALQKGPRSEPLPSNGWHWSLSHTVEYVAAVTAGKPVGIDIERIQPFTEELKQRVADSQEWALGPELSQTLFCRFWTAKEAVLKAAGAGLGGLAQCTITGVTGDDQVRLSYGSETWTVSHFQGARQHLAAISVDAGRVQWHLLPEEEE